MRTWAEDLIEFYGGLTFPKRLPEGISWLYPQEDPRVMKVVKEFCEKFFNDPHKRRLMLGINPGRFGAGVTGVNFTAPRQLSEVCHIAHPFGNQSELSAEFIYAMIEAYGGTEAFYHHFFIGSVCPLGFVQHNKNLNYYDDKKLYETVKPFIVDSIEKQLRFPVERDVCFCIGGEKNLKHLSSLNEMYGWFTHIIPLPHPRFIMQYRRKFKDEYIKEYIDKLRAVYS